MKYKMIEFRTRDAGRDGALAFCEPLLEAGFESKRFYFIYGTGKGCKRGGHAHKTLKQLLYCPYGKIRIILDDGTEHIEVSLDNPKMGLLIEPIIWHEMIWEEENSVLCVEASMYYSEEDYIRDYDMFLQYIKEKTI